MDTYTMTSQDDLVTMLDDIEKKEGKLSDWDRDFIDNVGKRILDSKPLSEAQDRIFCQIWDRVTS